LRNHEGPRTIEQSLLLVKVPLDLLLSIFFRKEAIDVGVGIANLGDDDDLFSFPGGNLKRIGVMIALVLGFPKNLFPDFCIVVSLIKPLPAAALAVLLLFLNRFAFELERSAKGFLLPDLVMVERMDDGGFKELLLCTPPVVTYGLLNPCDMLAGVPKSPPISDCSLWKLTILPLVETGLCRVVLLMVEANVELTIVAWLSLKYPPWERANEL